MNNKFFTDIKNIRAAIDTNKLVIFAGAGISIDAGIPGWGTLIEEMKSEINIPESEKDYLRIAQMYFNDRQQKEYIDKIRSVLKHKKIIHNEIHEELFRLNPEHILTTNFDDLLEQVIKKRSLPFSVVSRDNQFPYSLNTNLLVKLHGDLDEIDIVLKEDDFIDYSNNHPLIEAFLKSVFASKIVLFVGYSFSDINLKMIIQNVRNILGQNFQNAYLLSVDSKVNLNQKEYFKNKGVNIISYSDAEDTQGKNYIKEYLSGNNALNEVYYKEVVNLSPKGQQLFNFLKFISCYDKFNEPLTEKNLVDQIYLSLERFTEFTSLPPDFVANLFPFNNSKDYVYNYERYFLRSSHILFDLFEEQVEYVDDEVNFKQSPNSNLSANQVKDFEVKFKKIVKTLNFSLIFGLRRLSEKPDSFGNYGWSKNVIQLKSKVSRCECLICKFGRLEFDKVVIETSNFTVDETTSIQSDLELAYTQYKLGNFTQSFKHFDEIANKAWQAGKYFSYYIAKHNAKTLKNLVGFFTYNLNEKNRKDIIKVIDDIDLDKLLFQIPFMGEKEYKLLKVIRDDEVLKNSDLRINSIHSKLLSTYDLYKRGGTSSGTYYPDEIFLEFNKVTSFYISNYIVADEFQNFTRVIKKGIEALLICYAIDNNYSERLEKFNKSFFDIVIFYGDAKEIRDITRKYKINKLLFEEADLVEIIELANNFLKSFFDETTLFGKNTFANKTTKSQVNNTFFEDKLRKTFNNIFVLLSGVELSKEHENNFIYNLINFIEHESFLHYYDIQFLSSFIYKNHILFSKENFEKLLNIILPKIDIYNRGNLIDSIVVAFKKNDFAGISNKDLIIKIILLSKSADLKFNTIINLWSISDQNIKEELKQMVIEELNIKFNSDLYANACFKEVINHENYLDQYLFEINKKKGTGNYSIKSGRPSLESFVFLNAMIFIYEIDIVPDDTWLNKLHNLTPYMEFYLFPETFNYDNFKVEWLLFANREIFYNRFKSIPQIKHIIETSLKENFNKELAAIYIKFFI